MYFIFPIRLSRLSKETICCLRAPLVNADSISFQICFDLCQHKYNFWYYTCKHYSVLHPEYALCWNPSKCCHMILKFSCVCFKQKLSVVLNTFFFLLCCVGLMMQRDVVAVIKESLSLFLFINGS